MAMILVGSKDAVKDIILKADNVGKAMDAVDNIDVNNGGGVIGGSLLLGGSAILIFLAGKTVESLATGSNKPLAHLDDTETALEIPVNENTIAIDVKGKSTGVIETKRDVDGEGGHHAIPVLDTANGMHIPITSP